MYYLATSLFVLMISSSMLSERMFLDGLLYADIAKNMSEGVCGMWNPCISECYMPTFYGHPTLSMYLLSIIYRITQPDNILNTILIAKAYSIGMTVLTGGLTVRLWKKIGGKAKDGWLPLLLWILIPCVSGNAYDNMLETAMSPWVAGCVLLMLHGEESKSHWQRWTWYALAGAALTGAAFTKGLTGLYPIAFPTIASLLPTQPEENIKKRTSKAITGTLATLAGMVATSALILLSSPAAWEFVQQYFGIQVTKGVNVVSVDSRWYIVGKFIAQTAIVWCILIAAIVWKVFHKDITLSKIKEQATKPYCRRALQLILLTICGVLPIMISMKQRTFYILTVFPFFAIGMAMIIKTITQGITPLVIKKTATYIIATCVMATGITIAVYNYGDSGRDSKILDDLNVLAALIPDNALIGIPGELKGEDSMRLYYYMARHTCMSENWEDCKLILCTYSLYEKHGGKWCRYKPIETETKEYLLLEKKD